MEKLIITCCVTSLEPDEPITPKEVIASIKEAEAAGAAIAHVHQRAPEGTPEPRFAVDHWIDFAKQLRAESDIIYQHGMGGTPYIFPPDVAKQTYDLKLEQPDQLCFTPQAMDFNLPRKDSGESGGAGRMGGMDAADRPPAPNMSMNRYELERRAKICKDAGVKIEFETWHTGGIWNVNYLAENGFAAPPHWFTLAFGGPGSAWTPPNLEELLHRIQYLPPNSLWEVATKVGQDWGVTVFEQRALQVHAILLGGHVRTGLEDCGWYEDGVPAKSNGQLVERIARIARDCGREIATPAEARKMLGL